MVLEVIKTNTTTRVCNLVLNHMFKDFGPFYKDYLADNDTIATFLNRSCLLKQSNCHPARVTARILTISEYVVGATFVRDSTNPGTDCPVTSFCIHDGNGNGYEYALIESGNRIEVYKETNWGRTLLIRKPCKLEYDRFHLLVGKRRNDGVIVVEVYTLDGKPLAKGEATDTTYSSFNHISFCGGKPYYVHSVAITNKYYEDINVR